MAEIAVQVEALRGVARALDGAGEQLVAAAGELVGATVDVVGDARLAAALLQFTDHWEHGLTSLGRSTSVTGDQLVEALRAYESVEARLAQAAG